ncbi:MAG: hypothetical protein JWP35_4261 [Caulobacter sp.]|nr:hypothetical protein [Caulobacter sp.]
MPTKVVIGITTYIDITDPAFGAALFDAYTATSDRLAPNQVKVWSTTTPIVTAADFGRLWLTRTPYEAREKRGGEITNKSEFLIGAEWRRTGVMSGTGQVHFRYDPADANSLQLEGTYSSKIDWPELFERLIAIFSPSYAMLHLFTPTELEPHPNSRFGFNGAVFGEPHFTSWLSSNGDWRKPDSFDREARRQYRFLTELSWANYLGSEFEGQYDAGVIKSEAASARKLGNGFLFQATTKPDDVVNSPQMFRSKRDTLKKAFRPGFFRQ